MEHSEEHIRIWHPDGREHQLIVAFASTPFNALIAAEYKCGCANVKAGTQIALWKVGYVPPNSNDSGHVWFGEGRIDIEIPELRGIGIGSLLMLPLVRWAKTKPDSVPVASVDLEGRDAKTVDERNRRNKFYKKLGFVFNYQDKEQTWGASREMPVSQLITPTFKMSQGWEIESLLGSGSVFCLPNPAN